MDCPKVYRGYRSDPTFIPDDGENLRPDGVSYII